MASKGAFSAQPRVPSPATTSTLSYPSSAMRARARSASVRYRSIAYTRPTIRPMTAAAYPEPAPTSSTRSPGSSSSASIMTATM